MAKVISYLFHPVFLPSLLILALNYFAPLPLFYVFIQPKLFGALWGLVFLYTTVIPLLFVYLLYRQKFVSNMTVDAQIERPKVYLFVCGFYAALAYFLYSKGGVFYPTASLIVVMAINIFGLLIFTLFDKISAHASGMAGGVGIFYGIFHLYRDTHLVPVILLLIILWGIVASARLALGAHNMRQIVAGTAWGFLTGFIGTAYLLVL